MTNEEFKNLSYVDKIKHNLPAIIAFSNGEAIEATVTGSNEYCEMKSLNYIQGFPHRIKPKTKKIWINLYKNPIHNSVEYIGYSYDSKYLADMHSSTKICVEIEVPIEV